MSKSKTKVIAVKDGKRVVVDADFDELNPPDWYKELVKDGNDATEQPTDQ